MFCVDLRWRYLPLPKWLFQNSSYSAVAKRNETLLGGTRVEEQEGQYVWWQGPEESNSEKNTVGKKTIQKESEKDTKIQLGKMLSL